MCFEDGRVVFLDGDKDCVNPKPITQLVKQFMKIAGCNDVEYRDKVAPPNTASWGMEGVRCVCQIRGQCPCSKMIDLPTSVYYRPIENGPRDHFGRVVDLSELPEGTSQICCPNSKYFMLHDKQQVY